MRPPVSGHQLFNEIAENDYDNPTLLDLPLHGGCTYISVAKDVVRIGCDYQHAGDGRFAFYKTREEAWEVFEDAARLIEKLETM